MVGIVYKMKFVSPKNKKYATYIRYMSRDEATRTEWYEDYNFAFDDLKKSDLESYNDYMGRPQATSGLFSIENDELTEKQVLQLKKQFRTAQKNHSLMWQDVVSFDNDFLEKYGLYNSETKTLDDKKIKQAARLAVSDMLEREGMSNSAVWSGAIHYNTGNLHIHLAIVEPEPTRPKRVFESKYGTPYEDYVGTRRKTAGGQTSYERFKSLILENIIDHSEKSRAISKLQREVITSKDKKFVSLFDFEARRNFKKIFKTLPSDKRLWKYRNNAMKEVRPLIDNFNQRFIERNFKEEFQTFTRLLDEQVEYFKDAYGDSRAEDYKQNKLYGKDGLYTTLGNALLKEMNAYDKEIKAQYGIQGKGKIDLTHLPKQSNGKRKMASISPKTLRQIQHLFDKTFEQKQREFSAERFKKELEKEREM